MRHVVTPRDRPEALAAAHDVFDLVAGALAVLRLGQPRIRALAVSAERLA